MMAFKQTNNKQTNKNKTTTTNKRTNNRLQQTNQEFYASPKQTISKQKLGLTKGQIHSTK